VRFRVAKIFVFIARIIPSAMQKQQGKLTKKQAQPKQPKSNDYDA
jgi:hypothetical protein